MSDAALLNSLIDADFDLPRDERIMAQGLIAASAENPELIAPAQQHVEAVFAQLGLTKTHGDVGTDHFSGLPGAPVSGAAGAVVTQHR